MGLFWFLCFLFLAWLPCTACNLVLVDWIFESPCWWFFSWKGVWVGDCVQERGVRWRLRLRWEQWVRRGLLQSTREWRSMNKFFWDLCWSAQSNFRLLTLIPVMVILFFLAFPIFLCPSWKVGELFAFFYCWLNTEKFSYFIVMLCVANLLPLQNWSIKFYAPVPLLLINMFKHFWFRTHVMAVELCGWVMNWNSLFMNCYFQHFLDYFNVSVVYYKSSKIF